MSDAQDLWRLLYRVANSPHEPALIGLLDELVSRTQNSCSSDGTVEEAQWRLANSILTCAHTLASLRGDLEKCWPETPSEGSDTVYFSAVESERLSCEHPAEAVCEYLEDCSSLAEVESQCPVTVVSYSPNVPSDRSKQFWATGLSEHFSELFAEDFGDPEESLSEAVSEDLKLIFRVAVDQALKKSRLWRCSETGSTSYTYEQVLEIIKENQPEWLEEYEENAST